MHNLQKLKANAPQACYHGARSGFRSGDLFAQSHGGFDSFNDVLVLGVRVFTVSTYSHVGVIHVDPVDGRVYAVEAVRPCARRVLLSEVGNFYHLPMRQARWTEVTTDYVRSILGTLYSRWAAIRAFFSPLPAGSVSECAALTREVMLRAGVDLGPMSRPDSVVKRALELGSSITFVQHVD